MLYIGRYAFRYIFLSYLFSQLHIHICVLWLNCLFQQVYIEWCQRIVISELATLFLYSNRFENWQFCWISCLFIMSELKLDLGLCVTNPIIVRPWHLKSGKYRGRQILFFGKCFKKNYWIFSQISFFIWKYDSSN